MAIKGLDKVQRNLVKEIEKIKNKTLGGFVSAGLFIRRESQVECPLVTGNLKNSSYVVTCKGGVPAGKADFTGPDAEENAKNHAQVIEDAKAEISKEEISVSVGYSAVYAAAVHENPRAGKTEGVSPQGVKYTAGLTESGRKSTRKVYSTVGKWKFLEDPIKNNTRQILKLIADKAKIK